MDLKGTWSIAVFTRNEGRALRNFLASLDAAAGPNPFRVTLLANGCNNEEEQAIRSLSNEFLHVRVATLAVGDKANAWNHYVHDLAPHDDDLGQCTHFFADGDVTLEPNALITLANALANAPGAVAAGAMPASGRDRDAWRVRMAANGILAGGLYALRGNFLLRLRQRGIRMPTGFIGDDWLVSYLAAGNLGESSSNAGESIIFPPDAEFRFRSLNPLVPADYATYVRRLWRYALRGIQFEMLVNLLAIESLESMPSDVFELYARGLLPSRLKWVGWRSAIRTAAVISVRAVRAKGRQR